MNPRFDRLLSLIILLTMLAIAAASAHASTRYTVIEVGTKSSRNCFGATQFLRLLAGRETPPFPDGWTFVLACNQVVWKTYLEQTHADTQRAFTFIDAHVTVLNNEIFDPSADIVGNATADGPLNTLKHEYGHYKCQCLNEHEANEAGGSYPLPNRGDQQ